MPGTTGDHVLQFRDRLGELLVGQPDRALPVEEAFTGGLGVVPGEVAVEVGHEGGGEDGEGLPVALLGHGGAGALVDEGLLLAHAVAAPDGAADAFLAAHRQDTGLGERARLPVHGGGGDVREPFAARGEVAAVALLAGFAGTGEAAFRRRAASVFRGLPAPERLLCRPLGALGEQVLARIGRTTTDVARVAGKEANARWRLRARMGTFRVCLVRGAVWAVWHLPLVFIDGTVQHDLGLATPSGILFIASNIPMTMLVTAAHERAGIGASIATHFAANMAMILLAVEAPEVRR
ncbi:hypothetical protein ACFW5S_02390 [Streptomyces olivaceus]|uniref:hypothetical protein n=1 Tax=Streptomyces olivaceus TaxID=47716 RepID=UPI0036846C5F